MSFLIKSFKKKRGIRQFIGPKRIILFSILFGLVAWLWHAYQTGQLNPHFIEQYRLDHPLVSIFLFIGIYALSVIAVLPSLPLNLAGGFFWGGLLGGIYSTIGVTLGGWIAFIVARLLLGQPLTQQWNSKWGNLVCREFEKSDWKFVAFARLNPIIPTGPLNYLLGLTSITSYSFLCTSFIFLLLPSIAVSYVGDILQTFTAQTAEIAEIIRGILIVSGAVTFLALVKLGTKFYKLRSEKE